MKHKQYKTGFKRVQSSQRYKKLKDVELLARRSSDRSYFTRVLFDDCMTAYSAMDPKRIGRSWIEGEVDRTLGLEGWDDVLEVYYVRFWRKNGGKVSAADVEFLGQIHGHSEDTVRDTIFGRTPSMASARANWLADKMERIVAAGWIGKR